MALRDFVHIQWIFQQKIWLLIPITYSFSPRNYVFIGEAFLPSHVSEKYFTYIPVLYASSNFTLMQTSFQLFFLKSSAPCYVRKKNCMKYNRNMTCLRNSPPPKSLLNNNIMLCVHSLKVSFMHTYIHNILSLG